MNNIPFKNLIDFGTRLLVRRGVPPGDAQYIAEVAATAEAMGITTHGLVQLNALDGQIGKGIDPTKQPWTVKDHGAMALIDGDGAIGQIAMRMAGQLGAQKAKQHGVALIGVGNTSWIAALSVYLIPLAKEGFLAQVWCQSSQCQDCAPVGGIDPRLSTNPIALAFPTGGDPVVADFSTAAVSMGRTSRLAKAGQKAPYPIFMDDTGKITDDPTVMVDAKGSRKGGSILFWGGESEGHKGYALSLWCEAMTALAGGRTNDPDAPQRQSFCLLVIDPQAFAGREYFEEQIQHLIQWLRTSRLRPGVDRIRLPGERGQESLRQAEKHGVPVDEKVLARLNTLAAKHEIPGVIGG
jgi:LDH2 family malate/lactate/ureidoglycolate dehydrogenase